MLADHQVGWVLVAYPDERFGSRLRAGRDSNWSDARTTSMEPGQPVLFLQLGPPSPRWAGVGRIVGVQERWRMFGVVVRCLERFAPPLPAVPGRNPRATAVARSLADELDNAPVWENRTLAEVLGLHRSPYRTPYLGEGRVVRVTAGDLGLVRQLQPSLARVWPER